MRPFVVVEYTPLLNLVLGILQAAKALLIQAVFLKVAVEGLNECVLPRLPWFNKLNLNAVFGRLGEEHSTAEFGPIIYSNPVRPAVLSR